MEYKSIDKYIKELRSAGLSNDQVSEQLKLKNFDAYEPPVSQMYQQWRRASIQSGAELSSDRPMIDQASNIENVSSRNAGNPYLTKQRILANDVKFADINKNATENLYETNPEYTGQFGQGQVGAMAGALAAPAIQYANEATHNQFNPVAIQGAGEGSDIVPQDPNAGYNSLSRQYLQNKYGR